uniref:Uncharacterized protein n=1 Tax=Oryzias latipes TaxID=8090 RepID=A0A3P9H6L7_ORYLA
MDVLIGYQTLILHSLFLNATIKAFKGYNEEIASMRLMVLQNRLVLEFLVAQERGVCKMLNDTCCTFIPDNIDEGHSITQALHQLEKVQSWRKWPGKGKSLDIYCLEGCPRDPMDEWMDRWLDGWLDGWID